MKYEIESKFEVRDDTKIKKFLEDAKFIRKGFQKDIYYDTCDATYFKKAIFFRVRENKRLDFKFNMDFTKGDKHDGCIESCFDLPLKKEDIDKINHTIDILKMSKIDVADFEEFLDVNSFGVFVPIEKEYSLYEKNGFKIRLDIVKNLGEYIEIEKVVDSKEEIGKIKEEIKVLEKKLDLHFGSYCIN